LAKSTQNLDITGHFMVPKHEKLSEKEKKELFERYNISQRELPKILISDAAIQGLDLKDGDVIKIIRKNKLLGESYFYRGVVADES